VVVFFILFPPCFWATYAATLFRPPADCQALFHDFFVMFQHQSQEGWRDRSQGCVSCISRLSFRAKSGNLWTCFRRTGYISAIISDGFRIGKIFPTRVRI